MTRKPLSLIWVCGCGNTWELPRIERPPRDTYGTPRCPDCERGAMNPDNEQETKV